MNIYKRMNTDYRSPITDHRPDNYREPITYFSHLLFLCTLYFVLNTSLLHSATFTVTNTNDTGPGSLAQAITDANASPGADNITFNITGGTVPYIISLSNTLPNITDPVSIDATTQPGYSGPGTGIVIYLNNLSDGLIIASTGAGTVIKGLYIRDAQNNGIIVRANNCIIQNNVISNCNYELLIETGINNVQVINNLIGTDETGLQGMGVIGGIYGATIANCLIQNNLISGNIIGMEIYSSNNNTFKGNKVGTDINGTTAIDNSQSGVYIEGNGNFIGGVNAGESNLISGNGVGLGTNGTGNQIKGNKIGTDVSGNNPLPNNGRGIVINSSNNFIGGANPGEGNIVANNQVGVFIQSVTGLPADFNLISRNLIYNQPKGIDLHYNTANVGNQNKQPPTLTSQISGTGTASVSGTSLPNDIIELFKSDAGGINANQYLGTATATAAGDWTITGLTLTPTDKVIATATDLNNNTSEFSSPNIQTPARYWVGNGTNTSWNNSANWAFTSGGSGGALVPTSSNNVIFDGSGTGNCSIDAAVNVKGISISGYLGIISQNNFVITTDVSGFSISSGTFNGGNSNITLKGNFLVSGGNFKSTSSTLFAGGNYTISGGTFLNNNGIVIFNGTTAQAVNINNSNQTFNKMKVQKPSGKLNIQTHIVVLN